MNIRSSHWQILGLYDSWDHWTLRLTHCSIPRQLHSSSASARQNSRISVSLSPLLSQWSKSPRVQERPRHFRIYWEWSDSPRLQWILVITSIICSQKSKISSDCVSVAIVFTADSYNPASTLKDRFVFLSEFDSHSKTPTRALNLTLLFLLSEWR